MRSRLGIQLGRQRRNKERGNAMIEFALCMTFLTPLLLGTFNTGMNLARNLEVTQLARNAGHMYVRWVDFSQPASQDLVVRLAQGLNLRRDGTGDGVVILSQIMVPTEDDCDAASLSSSQCVNRDLPVIIHRIAFGNTSLRSSHFGTPPSSLIDSAGSISMTDYLTNAATRASNWTNLELKQNEVAYVAEVYFRTPSWSIGSMGGEGIYARAIY